MAVDLPPFNGHYHLSFGAVKQKAGWGAPPKGIVIFAFDSTEQAHAWYDSPAYGAIRPIRQAATKGRTFLVNVAP